MASWNAICWTPEQDAAIRRVYENKEHGGNKRLAARWNIAPGLISDRAARIGLPSLVCTHNRCTQEQWKEPEIALVRAHLGEPLAQIRARLYRQGYRRSLASVRALIERRRNKNEWPSRAEQIDDSDSLTVAELCAGMGVRDYIVDRWIKAGYLRARTVGGDGLRAVRWADLRRFLCDYAAHWDHRKADRWFLIEALTYVEVKPPRKKAA